MNKPNCVLEFVLLSGLLALAPFLRGAETGAKAGEKTISSAEKPKSPVVNVPWDAETLGAPMPDDADYRTFYGHVPKADYPALRDRFNPEKRNPKAFEFQKIDYPTGEANPTSYRFDMGPKDGPLENGFTRVTKEDLFSWEKGWGWEGKPAGDYLYAGPEDDAARKEADFGLLQMNQLAKAYERQGKEFDRPGARRFDNADPMRRFFLDDMARDAILNPGELAFKVALPNGHYTVSMIVGDVQLPRYGMEVYANGDLVASDNYTLETPWPTRVTFPVNVLRNNLRIALRPNSNAFLEHAETAAAPPDYHFSQLGLGIGAKPNRWLPVFGKQMNLWGPATQMAIAGIGIAPYKAPPLELIRQEIRPAANLKEKNALEGARLYNAGDRKGAEKSFARIPDSETWLKAHAWLALAGHLETQTADEFRYVEAAVGLLEKGMQANPDDVAGDDLLRELKMYRGGLRYFARQFLPSLKVEGLPEELSRQQDSQGRAANRRKETVTFTWVRPGDILYSKALMRYARHLAAGDPHRWTPAWRSVEVALLKLQAQEPGNRFSEYFLYGNTAGWDVPDYTRDTQGAPKWAVYMREGYNRLLDQAAWWGQNRLQADGSLGGGWGDDVEVGQLFEILALLSPDANPEATNAALAIAEGVWWSGEIDRDTGFYDGIADVEHTAEWTGDSQPFLLAIDYGNPIYYERNLKTGKLMRDLWMGRTPRGHLHFKSMVLGNKAVGDKYSGAMDAETDCPLNGRATTPAYWAWWYSPVDGLNHLFTNWAKAWLEDSMREENGKPAGVIPGPIGFHTDVLGGNKASVWRQGAPQTNSYENPKYSDYILSLFSRMHSLTGDARWLAPKAVRLTSKEVLMDQFDRVPNLAEEIGAGDKYERFKEIDIEKILKTMREVWPSVTSENSNTDRIGLPGFAQVMDLLTGGEVESGMDFIPMTLQKTSKQVAFMNLSTSRKGARTIFYNFSDEPEAVRLRLWKLQVGSDHEVTVGVDKDDDDRIDETLQTTTFHYTHRGDPVEFTLPSRKAIVVEVKQTKAGEGMAKRVVDLALAAEDIEIRDGKLHATVHNIGNEKCGAFEMKVWEGKAGKGKLLRTFTIDGLEAPNDLEPRTVTKSLDWSPPKGASLKSPAEITVELDPADRYYEITEQNNVKSRLFPHERKSYQTPRLWKTLAEEHGLKQWEPFPEGMAAR